MPVYTMGHVELERQNLTRSYEQGTRYVMLEDIETMSFEYYGYQYSSYSFVTRSDYRGSKMMSLPAMVRLRFRQGGEDKMSVFSLNTNDAFKVQYNERYVY